MRRDILDIKESNVEKRLVRLVDYYQGIAWKFMSPENRSVPDRFVVLNGWLSFVELKAPGKTLTDKQQLKFDDLRFQGVSCWMLNTYAAVDFFIDWCFLSKGPLVSYTLKTLKWPYMRQLEIDIVRDDNA